MCKLLRCLTSTLSATLREVWICSHVSYKQELNHSTSACINTGHLSTTSTHTTQLQCQTNGKDFVGPVRAAHGAHMLMVHNKWYKWIGEASNLLRSRGSSHRSQATSNQALVRRLPLCSAAQPPYAPHPLSLQPASPVLASLAVSSFLPPSRQPCPALSHSDGAPLLNPSHHPAASLLSPSVTHAAPSLLAPSLPVTLTAPHCQPACRKRLVLKPPSFASLPSHPLAATATRQSRGPCPCCSRLHCPHPCCYCRQQPSARADQATPPPP